MNRFLMSHFVLLQGKNKSLGTKCKSYCTKTALFTGNVNYSVFFVILDRCNPIFVNFRQACLYDFICRVRFLYMSHRKIDLISLHI